MLEITESDTKYKKTDKKVREFDTVCKNLFVARPGALETQDELPTIWENVEIHAPNEFYPGIRTLLR